MPSSLNIRARKRRALSSAPSSDFATAAQALASAAAALESVARAFQASPASSRPSVHSPPQDDRFDDCELSWGGLVREFLISKAKMGRSDRYLRQLRASLAPWVKGRARRPARTITTGDLEAWIEHRGGSARTRKGYIADLRTLFGWAERRDWIQKNPAAGLENPPRGEERSIQVHTPEDVAKVLAAAYQNSPDVGRHLAVRYFAGVRSAEAHRLREDAVLSDRGVIEVTAARSKTRSRRLVTIQPALAAFLALGGQLGPLSPNTVKKAWRAAGVEWPHNVTRHSFVTYHLAQFESAAKTALEAGHSESILFRHYRALVTSEKASAFWALRPCA